MIRLIFGFRANNIALITCLFVVMLSVNASAYVYDDFSGSGIDPSKWTDAGPNYGLFSQPGDGYLYFNDTAGHQRDSLKSEQISGAFFATLQYSITSVSNNNPPPLGSSINFEIGYNLGAPLLNFVNVYEYKNATGYGFGTQHIVGDVSYQGPGVNPPVYATTATLGIYYDGQLGDAGRATLMFNDGTGWVTLTTFDTNFSYLPKIVINGNDINGSNMSVRMDNVQVAPVPEPATMLLLGSGLAGLVAFRRRFRKR